MGRLRHVADALPEVEYNVFYGQIELREGWGGNAADAHFSTMAAQLTGQRDALRSRPRHADEVEHR